MTKLVDVTKQEQINNAIAILRAWHKVEFFQPYKIPDDSNYENKGVKITFDELQRQQDAILPWLDTNARLQIGLYPEQHAMYTLHINLFDLNEINTIVDNVFNEVSDGYQEVEWEERKDENLTEGFSCYAKLTVDQNGTPLFDTMSVSTLPWALGKLCQNALDQLVMTEFEKSCEKLQEGLCRIENELPLHPDNEGLKVLNSSSLYKLSKLLNDWANLNLEDNLWLFKIDWKEIKSNKKEEQLKLLRHDGMEDGSSRDNLLSDRREEEEEEGAQEADEENDANEFVMPILNSFYIEDIERVICFLSAGFDHKPLMSYLSFVDEKHVDLYTPNALPLIADKLSPDMTPRARWPSKISHQMSLMQQFAINTVFDELHNEGVLSINGPPGTGKTTLLRDIVAENLVNRSKVLASFDDVRKSLDEQFYPKSELFGFEMVVASSNNKAVENISKELPLRKDIDGLFSDLSYLSSVANQVNAKKRKGHLQAMNDQEHCWGLISAAGGSSRNRKNLVDRMFYTKHYQPYSEQESKRPIGFDYLNFWRWRDVEQEKIESFSQAKYKFNKKYDELERYRDKIKKFQELQAYFKEYNKDKATIEQRQALDVAKLAYEDYVALNESIEEKCKRFEERIKFIEDELSLYKKPHWLSYLFKRAKVKAYQNQLSTITKELLEQRKLYLSFKDTHVDFDRKVKLNHLKNNLEKAQEALGKAVLQFKNKEALFEELNQSLVDLRIPCHAHSIYDVDTQRQSYWQSEYLNCLRSELFVCAMHLHQSWLYEASCYELFRQNVLFGLSQLLQGGCQIRQETLWKSLFLMVPVLSTTFASVGNMFRSIGCAQLGWLMIDEAGQAVPHAAVGSIWRAKRTVVVGDPLQIEPVFTTPQKLVDKLMDSVLPNSYQDWLPYQYSVQQVADRANQYGCNISINNQKTWIGIPLWVHRRCIDPMFSVANKIAYESRMIHGFENEKIQPQLHSSLGQNKWIQVSGVCTVKQYVPEIGERVSYLLQEVTKNSKSALSSIYVITPFKAVKKELQALMYRLMSQSSIFNNVGYKELSFWIKNNIGTVHTFQGKENETVILALGCDQQNEGGAWWASGKPNLLNVAITRAKRNLYVIGDWNIWGQKKYFKELYQQLERNKRIENVC
ncbi:AAA domain-containing protein [Cysteiniphilum sp. QT6929]|uniref:DEAD/DEAH box helicase n=1 Tax=Cysteiniphilum sp. QT6929 TaxID=2975055 RepID=UPI0024B3629A|nr:AAA domain-containing protein [Cysteiniphilum sp. QT6929]WHN65395.1 AAA domain-containing protein [Cysteiniphilum sp. QT6929]